MLAAGALPLWGAVVADVGASLIVVANGLRLVRGHPAGGLRGAPILLRTSRRAERGETSGSDRRDDQAHPANDHAGHRHAEHDHDHSEEEARV